MDIQFSVAEENVVWREVDGQVVALDKRTWNYLSINASGALLWKQIAGGGATRVELVERLREDYELDEQTAMRDVDAFISSMQAHELLRGGEDRR